MDISPRQVKQRPNDKNPAYEEIVLSAKLGQNADFVVDFRGISAFLKPSQDMANFISQELARVKNKIPTYTPFIAPALEKAPWPVASQAHSLALTKWQSNARQASRPTQPQLVPFQAWILYQLRFLATAEICGAWLLYGGLVAQLNHLSITLHLATVESMAVALSYDRLAQAHLAEKARAREDLSQPAPAAVAENEFSKILSNEQPHFRQQAINENPRQLATNAKREPKTPKHSKNQARGPQPKSEVKNAKPAWGDNRFQKRKRSASPRRNGRSRRKEQPPQKNGRRMRQILQILKSVKRVFLF